jgi:hypothetical protein
MAEKAATGPNWIGSCEEFASASRRDFHLPAPIQSDTIALSGARSGCRL